MQVALDRTPEQAECLHDRLFLMRGPKRYSAQIEVIGGRVTRRAIGSTPDLGDVIVESDDLYGDGVNIAARVEALADPGGVFVSNTVYDHVRDRLPFDFQDLGEQQVKNIARPVRVYRIRDVRAAESTPVPTPPAPRRQWS